MHVMKTGGTTFLWQLKSIFPRGERYPFLAGEQQRAQYTMVDELRKLTPETRRSLRLYCGHFPFVATTIVEPDVTMAILRDPVERTVSILRHFKRGADQYRDSPLEELYEDALLFPLFIHNYQTKLFAMTQADTPESHRDVIDVDDARLRIAKQNLERVDILGLADRHDEFLDDLHGRFGWRFPAVPDQRVSDEGREIPASFRLRIAADNAADVDLYESAVVLHERRSA
jgi:hypothetical protein